MIRKLFKEMYETRCGPGQDIYPEKRIELSDWIIENNIFEVDKNSMSSWSSWDVSDEEYIIFRLKFL